LAAFINKKTKENRSNYKSSIKKIIESPPMKILINFFASIYDVFYDSIVFILKTIIKILLKIKKKGLKNILITVFASLYDLVYNLIIFLKDYIIWTTDFRPSKSTDVTKHAK